MNQDLWSVILLTTSGSANNVITKFGGKEAEDGAGDGHAARETLDETYNSHTKEASGAYHEKLISTKTEPDRDSDDLFFVLDGCRDLLEERGQTVHDERYKDTVLQAFPAEYERIRNASYEKREIELVDIWNMLHAMFLDSLSRPFHSKLVAGWSIAIQAAGHTKSDVRYHSCSGTGYLLQKSGGMGPFGGDSALNVNTTIRRLVAKSRTAKK